MFILVNNSIRGEDRYTRRLAACLTHLSLPYKVCKTTNDVRRVLKRHDVKGCLLSGSTRMASDPLSLADIQAAMFVLTQTDLPVLGICFGSQLMTMLSGGELKRQAAITCTTLDVELQGGHPLFKSKNKSLGKDAGLVEMQFCFSDLIKIDKAPQLLRPISWFKMGQGHKKVACAFQHTRRPWYGCLFHPEFHESTYFVISNFAMLCEKPPTSG
jgi:GMP synthase-like glutamine amidotransferase